MLVLQGGGALGAYQAGAYQAIHEAGLEPDWVIGTSIGAINASLIVGSTPDDRMNKLREFWKRIEISRHALGSFTPQCEMALRNSFVLATGVPNFFRPNTGAFINPHTNLGPEGAGYYSVEPLAITLRDLVDFRRLNAVHQAHGWREQHPDGRDALFRQPRRGARFAAHS